METRKNCGPQREYSTSAKNDNSCIQIPNIVSKTTFKPVDIKEKCPSLQVFAHLSLWNLLFFVIF